MNKFTLVIAEKPSLGRSIAEALDKNFSSASGGGALEGNGIVVSWLFGHILELAPLESYNPAWKSWDQRTLPIRIDDWQYQVKEPKQLKIIENYLKNASEVIHAGDPDREGQLLVDEVLDYLKWRGRTKRLLPHATDKASILKAWGAMRSNEEFHPLYQAGMCRQRADFLVGLNTTIIMRRSSKAKTSWKRSMATLPGSSMPYEACPRISRLEKSPIRQSRLRHLPKQAREQQQASQQANHPASGPAQQAVLLGNNK